MDADRLAALLQPIAPEAPAGAELTYDPEFESLALEIEKLTALAGEETNWRFVAGTSERLLLERAKDLRLLSWYVAAKVHLEGWPAIASGLEAYVAVSRTFWEDLFPAAKRIRARTGQVEWLWEQLAQQIAKLPADASNAASVRAIAPLVDAARDFFAEKFGEADPSTVVMRTALRERLKTLPEEEKPVEAPPPPAYAEPTNVEPEAQVQAAPAPRPAPAQAVAAPTVDVATVDPTSMANLDATIDAARGLRSSLQTLAHHARTVAPTSPWSYQVLRFATWLTVEGAPESEGRKTPLRAPKSSDRETLDRVRASNGWDALLEASEDFVGEHIFWLDPHRMAALALENKGPAFGEARRALGREVLSFVERAPGVEELLFANDTRFASPETVDWIASLRAAASGGSGGGGGASEELVAFTEQVRAASGPDELAQLVASANRMATVGDRFRARLLVANHAQTSDQLDVALALYERLLPEVTDTLEAWEPALCGDLIANYLKAGRRQFAERERTEAEVAANEKREAALFQRLLSLDPHAALRSRA